MLSFCPRGTLYDCTHGAAPVPGSPEAWWPWSTPAVTCIGPTLGPQTSRPLGGLGKAKPQRHLCFFTGGKNETDPFKLPVLLTIPNSPVAPPASIKSPHWPRVLQKLGIYCAKPSLTATYRRPSARAWAAAAANPRVRRASSCLLGVPRPLSSHTFSPGMGLPGILFGLQQLLNTCLLANAAATVCGWQGDRCRPIRGRTGPHPTCLRPVEWATSKGSTEAGTRTHMHMYTHAHIRTHTRTHAQERGAASLLASPLLP